MVGHYKNLSRIQENERLDHLDAYNQQRLSIRRSRMTHGGMSVMTKLIEKPETHNGEKMPLFSMIIFIVEQCHTNHIDSCQIKLPYYKKIWSVLLLSSITLSVSASYMPKTFTL